VDPLNRQFPGWSSYSYVLANPISLIDPDGRAPGDPIKAQLADDGVPITYAEGITITAGTASPVWTATAAANFQNSMAYDPLRPEYKGQRSGIGTIHLTSRGAEITLDVVGTSEIPAVSTVADIGAAGFAFSNGDYWGGGLSLLGAIPAVGAIFNGVKWVKRFRNWTKFTKYRGINTVQDVVQKAENVTLLRKGNVIQGFLEGSADGTFQHLSKKYGANIQTGQSDEFFKSGGVRVGKHNSSRTGDNTLHINENGQLYKIRFSKK
jgi:hypothetical protein